MAELQDERPTWKRAVSIVITIFCVILIAYVIVSWIPGLRNGPVGAILETVVGPVVSPIRKVIPPMGGLDLSVLVLYLILSFIQRRFLR